MDMEFNLHECVNLMINGEVVAKGRVHALHPNDTCHMAILGFGNIAVTIDECIQGNAPLPFPNMDSSMVGDSIGSVVKWKKEYLQKVTLTNDNLDGETFRCEVSPTKAPCYEMSSRDSWRNKRVLLWSADNKTIDKQGVVLLVLPYEAIGFDVLGDADLGIVVEDTCDTSISHGSSIDSLNLVRWPIERITFMDGRPIHILQGDETCHADLDERCSDTQPKRRRYTMTNRIARGVVPKLLNNKLSMDVICEVSTIDCCNKKCCQLVDRKLLYTLRKDYWSMGLEARTNYVYDSMTMACRMDALGTRQYLFTFHGYEICPRSWYEMHGIPKTSYYRYKSYFENGVRRAMHGNKGIIRKAWDHTELGRAIIRDFVENNSDTMPHKSRTMGDGIREIQLVIPDVYKQVDILNEVNITLKQLNQKEMSNSTFNRIWNTKFMHVSLAQTSEFSKCATCSAIKDKLGATKNEHERKQIMHHRRVHMLQQRTCRNLYYAWRLKSVLDPNKYLCIIHDKMDQKKTAIPRFRVHSKDVDKSTQLPISLTGMITHGHGEGQYGNFAIGLWPSDPNFTIGSLTLCFKNLEREDNHGYGDLVHDGMPRTSNALLNALNSRKALDHHHRSSNVGGAPFMLSELMEIPSSDTSLTNNTFKRLPETLLLQLDNCASENKNRYLFAYLSLLVARGAFKTIQLGFLMVGHTHEDIDAMFSKFSERLRLSQTFTFPHLMFTFRECQSSHPSPFLMTKIPDFKGFIDGYLCEGADVLVGHSKPLQFLFYMKDGIPVMQYKVHPKSELWEPRDGAIELWKRDEEGNPMLPSGVPKVLPMFEYLKDHMQIIHGIKDYIKYWEKWTSISGPEAESTLYIQPVLEYWRNMVSELQKPNHAQIEGPCDSFWPRTGEFNITSEMENTRYDFAGIEEYNDHYCGPLSGKPKETFQAIVDVKKGDFVLVHPPEKEYPIWLGEALTNVDMDISSETYKMFYVQYWAPMCRNVNVSIAEVYADCWNKHWMCNKKDPPRWELADSVVFSWITKGQKKPKKVKIPASVCMKAKQSMDEEHLALCQGNEG